MCVSHEDGVRNFELRFIYLFSFIFLTIRMLSRDLTELASTDDISRSAAYSTRITVILQYYVIIVIIIYTSGNWTHYKYCQKITACKKYWQICVKNSETYDIKYNNYCDILYTRKNGNVWNSPWKYSFNLNFNVYIDFIINKWRDFQFSSIYGYLNR